MLENSFGITFFLKSSTSKTNVRYVYLRITVDGIPKETSTKRKWVTDRWDQKMERATGGKEDAKILNFFLDAMHMKIQQHKSELMLAGQLLTTQKLMDFVMGKNVSKAKIVEDFQRHNDELLALVKKGEYAIGTHVRFEIAKKHLKEYLSCKYQAGDLNIRHIDHEFIDGFDFYLHTSKDNDTNTASKHLKNLGKIVRICLRNKWIITDPFFGYKLKSKLVQREYLTADELQNIAGKKYSTARLTQVRDFFLFSCYTGLSYADVQKLKQTDIRIGIDGEKWLFSYRKKTGTPVAVPLIPIAADILERYKDHPFCVNQNRALPISSNQKMNEYLVEIAALSGIVKTLGNRIAKRTFATTVTLLNGVPIESVSKMMGHTNIRTTQLYAKMLDEKVSSDMAPLRQIFASI